LFDVEDNTLKIGRFSGMWF